MKIDQLFFEQMRALLGDEYDAYIAALDAPPMRGLRVNTLKISAEEFRTISPFALTPSPLCPEGFIARSDPRGRYAFGTHPYHHAGLYYMQEPSAMCAVAAARPYLGRRILDLCSAPGGKGTQAAALRPDAAVMLNEISFSRAKILMSNVERLGLKNALVTCNPPDFFARAYPEFFDTVLVDAPCSGEGMLRKEPEAALNWSVKNVEACAVRQREILSSAADALSPGGTLVYSTCTLNETENEDTVKAFLASRPDFTVLPPDPAVRKVCRGGRGIDAVRLFPQDGLGEGHFACILKKIGGKSGSLSAEKSPSDSAHNRPEKPSFSRGEFPSIRFENPFSPLGKVKTDFDALWREISLSPPAVNCVRYRDNLLVIPTDLPYVRGLSLLKAGITAFTDAGRLMPHHNLASSLRPAEAARCVSFPADSPEIAAYLRGEIPAVPAPFSGWGTVAADGYVLGLVKAADGVLKNHYPKGLRNR